MLPLFKLFSLFVRILARPVIARTKAHTSSKLQNQKFRKFFVWVGNKAHRANVYINRTFLKLNNHDFKVQDLSESAALELGVETFYEVIIYACILGLPIIEIYRAQVESNEKSEKQKQVMEGIFTRLQNLEDEKTKQTNQLDQLTCINTLLFRKSSVLENVLATQSALNQQNPLLKELEEINLSIQQQFSQNTPQALSQQQE
ncbi:hypothetical protein ABPG72_009963 [Tetrahymena utriculariae]